MTDVILSSFISLFALFGKEEQVDEMRAKNLLVDYLHRHFGIRNTDIYLDLYSDMRMAYEMTDGLNTIDTVTSICANLQGDIRNRDKALLLLRLMEFCCHDGAIRDDMFKTMAHEFNISDEQYNNFEDFVFNRPSDHVKLHNLDGFDGQLKTLLDPCTGLLLFSYMGNDTVLLNDIPVLSGVFQVWIQSSVLKNKTASPSIILRLSRAMVITMAKHVPLSFVDAISISASPIVTTACTTSVLRFIVASCWLSWEAREQERPPCSRFSMAV